MLGYSRFLENAIKFSNNNGFRNPEDIRPYNVGVRSSMVVEGNLEYVDKPIEFKIGTYGRSVVNNDNAPKMLNQLLMSRYFSSVVNGDLLNQGVRLSSPVMSCNYYEIVSRLARLMSHYCCWGRLTLDDVGEPYVPSFERRMLRNGESVSLGDRQVILYKSGRNSTCDWVDEEVIIRIVNECYGEVYLVGGNWRTFNRNSRFRDMRVTHTRLMKSVHRWLMKFRFIFQKNNQGCLFALALTDGLHKGSKVLGHSDEGAFFRKVFKSGHGGEAFGVIPVDWEEDNVFTYSPVNLQSARRLYDGMLLATAGGVALCDPMVKTPDGRTFPTMFHCSGGYLPSNVGSEEDAARHMNCYRNTCRSFGDIYAKFLSMLVNVEGGERTVVDLIEIKFKMVMNRRDAHLEHRAIVAYSWIEPTGSCPIGDDSFVAYTNCHGPLVVGSDTRTLPAFDGLCGESDPVQNGKSNLVVDLRYGRRHGAIIHHQISRSNGLVHITVASGLPEMFICQGGTANLETAIAPGTLKLSDIMWGRQDSSIVAPGELCYYGEAIRLIVHHTDRYRSDYGRNRVGTLSELVNGNVTLELGDVMCGNIRLQVDARPRDWVTRTREVCADRKANELGRANRSTNRSLRNNSLASVMREYVDGGPLAHESTLIRRILAENEDQNITFDNFREQVVPDQNQWLYNFTNANEFHIRRNDGSITSPNDILEPADEIKLEPYFDLYNGALLCAARNNVASRAEYVEIGRERIDRLDLMFKEYLCQRTWLIWGLSEGDGNG
jgi:hypothetical protein